MIKPRIYDWPQQHRQGFNAAFGALIDRDYIDFIPLEGAPDINEPQFFDRLFSEELKPEFLSYDDQWRERIIAGLEFVEGQEFEEVSSRWNAILMPFSLDEYQWVEFIRNVRLRFEEIMKSESTPPN